MTNVSDAAYIRALDSNGNPVLISKADLAQVAAELIGTATSSKDGLMSKTDYALIPKKVVVNRNYIARLGQRNAWARFYALVVGQISNSIVAFIWFAAHGETSLFIHEIHSLVGKDQVSGEVKIYEKEGTYYLDVDTSDKNCMFTFLSNFNAEQVSQQVDDTFTPLNPTIS